MVTIAIPFFNAERFLDLAVRSVFNQTYQEWKLLLIDDGSTDNSMLILDKFREDPRVKIISDGKNKNLGARLNEIPFLVDTKYLVRMDADDIMHPDRIARQIEILESNPDIDVLGTNAYSIDEDNNIQGLRRAISKEYEIRDVKNFIHPTIIAKTAWFMNNLYDVKAIRIEDTELWYRTIGKSVFKETSEPLLFYREFGFDYYKKYFKGIESHIYVTKKFKSFFWFKSIFVKVAKGMVYYFFAHFNKEDFLIKRRSLPINKELLDLGDQAIKRAIREINYK